MTEKIPVNQAREQKIEKAKEESLLFRWFNPNLSEEEREKLNVEIAEIVERDRTLREKEAADKTVILENKEMQEAIPELELPLQRIIKKIRERIEKGEYGLIIGDDASGRIPALVLGRFIQKVSEEKGQKIPKIIFIPGKLWARERYEEYPEDGYLGEYYEVFSNKVDTRGSKLMDLLDKYLTKYGADKSKRILVVTEIIESGDTLGYVYLLKKLGYTIDVATLSIFSDYVRAFEDSMTKAKRREANLESVEIIDGEFKKEDHNYGAHVPKIYKKNKLSGVERSKALDEWGMNEFVNSKPIERGSPETQKDINEARLQSKALVDSLINWYESQE